LIVDSRQAARQRVETIGYPSSANAAKSADAPAHCRDSAAVVACGLDPGSSFRDHGSRPYEEESIMKSIREADWKVFKQIRETALQRFCQQVLDEIDAINRDAALTAHERYIKVYELMQARDRKLAATFDKLSRSDAVFQLMLMRTLGLVSEEDLARFSPELQQHCVPPKFGGPGEIEGVR
jgi:hypothetical protein